MTVMVTPQDIGRQTIAIRVRDVRKRYGKLEAIRGFSLDVERGTIHGLLGPNGSGKSTLIQMLVGASRPTSGEVRILGMDPVHEARRVRPHIGYMPQSPALYDDLSPRANLRFFARPHHLPNLDEAIEETIDFISLQDRQHDPVHTFSGGMKQRVSLGCALVHHPDVLFLDEPTAGVDPKLKQGLWDRFRQLASQGVTLFLSTHLMDEALLCDRLTVLRGGEVLVDAPPKDIMQQGHTEVVVWRGGKAERTFVRHYYSELPSVLERYGLERDVTRIELHEDSLETIIISLVEGETP